MQYLLAGLGLGLGAGLAPGPLLALVVTTTLARGFAAGARAACGPLVSDGLIIALCVLVVRALPTTAVALLGIVGGLYVVWLGVEAVREVDVALEVAPGAGPDPLRRSVLVNLASPHPWIFWLTVGSPVLVAAWSDSPGAALAFLVGFFVLLVGSKVAVAGIVAAGRRTLSARGVRRAHRIAGALLLLTGVLLTTEFARALLP